MYSQTLTFLNVWLVGLTLFKQSEATLYRESLNMEELKSLFADDDCIEGSLSALEIDQPVFKFLSSESPPLFVEQVTKDKPQKSSLSSLHELADFNRIQYSYNVIEEHGPSHKKRFVVKLKIGEEEYLAEGQSIKKAQQEAARMAMNTTLYKQPPEKMQKEKLTVLKKTASQKLTSWITKYSGVDAKYFYSQHSKATAGYNDNYYHSEVENIHRVTVQIGEEKFFGEGLNANVAKENAAKRALANLHHLNGVCMLTDGERNLLEKLFGHDSENNSPVSLVTEFGLKSNIKVNFDLVSEEGPPHMKNFFIECTVGNLKSVGEGTNKKTAKRKAAENMLALLKKEAVSSNRDCGTILKKNSKNRSKRSKKVSKSDLKTYSNDEDYENNNNIHIPEKLDAISKLYRIMQATSRLPSFTNLQQKDQENNFLVEVTVDDISFIGSGPNKKAAKKKAAEGMLLKMGYSTEETNRESKFLKEKRQRFQKRHLKKKSVSLGAGVHFNPDSLREAIADKTHVPSQSTPKSLPSSEKSDVDHKPLKETLHSKTAYPKSDKSSKDQPRTQLEKLSKQFGFRFQFSDFPKGNNSGFVSLLSLTTDPTRVCYGVGDSVQFAQDRATLSAIENIYKTELKAISQILRTPMETSVEKNLKTKEAIIETIHELKIETD